jgi:hypothetical protein
MNHLERRLRRRAMAAAAHDGKPIEWVAFEFGVTVATVHGACRENGVVPRRIHSNPREKPVRQMWPTVLALLINSSKSLADIGRDLNISPQRVSQIKELAVGAGIPLHPARLGR